jgi:hypothetical protein
MNTRPGRPSAACVFVLVLLAMTCSSTPAGAQPTVRRPFAFVPPAPTRQVSLPHVREWAAALEEHEPGVVDEPARAAARSTRYLAAVFADFVAIRTALVDRRARVAELDDLLAKTPREDWRDLPLRRQFADTVSLPGWQGRVSELHATLGLTADEAATANLDRVLRRAILLHTDVAAFDSLAAARADQNEVVSVASQHFGMAMALVDLLRTVSPASRLPGQWYRAVAAFLREHLDVGSGALFMRRAVSFFPDDVRLLLLAGIMHEFLASPPVQAPLGLKDDPSLSTVVIGDERVNLQAAQEFMRRAAELDPDLAEARLRFGRMTSLLGDPQKGLTELQAALSRTSEPPLRFYAWLFIGQADAALGRREAARDAYREALVVFPHAQSASIALAHLERSYGDSMAAAAAVQRVLSVTGDAGEDPWLEYASGPIGHADEELRRLRLVFRDGKGQ